MKRFESIEKGLEYYQQNPIEWAEDYLGVTLDPKQRDLLISLRDNERTDFKSGNEVGKCVEESEDILLWDGKRVRASDLVGTSFSILSIDKGFNLVKATAWAEDNGIKDVVRIVTSTGKAIIRTINHRIWTGKGIFKDGETSIIENVGWKESGKITKGDLVATPTAIPSRKYGPPVDEDKIRLAAYLIGDGGLTVGVTFSQIKGPLLDDFFEIVKKYKCTIRQNDKYTYSTVKPKGVKRNPIISLCREWGIFGKRGDKKFVPDFVWGLSNKQLSLFLSCLYATDGCATSYDRNYNGKRVLNCRIDYTSCSERLIKDIQILLLRFGITSFTRKRFNQYTYKGIKKLSSRPAWELSIRNKRDIILFADKIGIFSKEAQVEECKRIALLKRDHINKWWYERNIPDGYQWERVVSLERLGKKKTVSISVEKTHTFVTTFIEHNTFGMAVASLQSLYCYPPATVILTSSTDRQLNRQLFPEIKKLWHGAKVKLPGRIITKYIEVDPKGKWFMLGFATSEEAKFEGYHNKNIFLFFDESKGIRADIWRAGERLFRGKGVRCRWVAAGTPPLGPVGEFCQISLDPKKARLWNHITCSGWDSPRVDDEKCQEALDTYGEDNPFYISMVMGRIPLKTETAIIDLQNVAKAVERKIEYGNHIDEVSADIARGGEDETVISYRKGWKVFQDVFRGKDKTTWVVGRIKELLSRQGDAKEIPIRIDDIGVGGGVVDGLEAEGYYVVPINVARSAARDDIYYDLGTEIYAQLGIALRDNPIDIPDDPELISQLYSRVDTRLKQKGGKLLLKVLSKEELKKDPLHKGNPSPDRSDSLAMLLCEIPSPEERKGDDRHVGSTVVVRPAAGGWSGKRAGRGDSSPSGIPGMIAVRRR